MKHLILFLISLLTLSACNSAPVATPDEAQSSSPAHPPLLSTSTRIASPVPSGTPNPTQTPIPSASPTQLSSFSFAAYGDPAFHSGPGEFDTTQYFRGAVEKMASLDQTLAFSVGVGDLVILDDTLWTLHTYLGETIPWYPVVGNHDMAPFDMAWLNAYDYEQNGELPPDIVRKGPSPCENTTYAFDHLNTHFVVLNIYCDTASEVRTDGAIVDLLYDWLKEDLEENLLEHVLVFGHEPAFPMGDAENGIMRHVGDSLDQYPITRDRFWELLKTHHVNAYITGHTHSYSVVNIEGVWQIDVGHVMGARTQATKSTFIVVEIVGDQLNLQAYRAGTDENYILYESISLNH